MAIASVMMVLATKGEKVVAETVGGRQIEVVEFFDPEALAERDEDTTESDGITIDVPFEMWHHMDCPTEMTVSLIPGNIMEEDIHRMENFV